MTFIQGFLYILRKTKKKYDMTIASVGIIGALGDMGRLYACQIAPHYAVHVADVRERVDELRAVYQSNFG